MSVEASVLAMALFVATLLEFETGVRFRLVWD